MAGMEHLISNISGQIRTATLAGRNYLVAPLSMIVEGVLNGSQGPLYYPLNEMKRDYHMWNGMPIVVTHPQMNGRHVSARDPEVFDKFGIGHVYKTSIVDNKLVAEGWFDIELTRKVDARILHALNNGGKMEVSTGLNVELEPATNSAEYNGKVYSHIAKNFRPDHLAILPDEIGACSLDDGCGLNVNSKDEKSVLNWLKDKLGLSPEPEGDHKPDKTEEGVMNKEELITYLISNCDCWEDSDKETLNGFSEDKLKSLKEQLDKQKTAETVTANATKAFEADGVKYEFDPKAGVWNAIKPEAPKADDEEEEVKPTPKKAANSKKEDKPMTEQEWMASAPESIRTLLNSAKKQEAEKREQLTDLIVANVDEDERDAKRQWCANKSTDDLEEIVSLLPKKPEAEPQSARYTGAAVPSHNRRRAFDENADLLVPPQMDYAS